MSAKRVVISESDADTPRQTCAAWLRLNCLKPNPDWSNQAQRYSDTHAVTALDGINSSPAQRPVGEVPNDKFGRKDEWAA
jgi:hypothetical protein